MRRVSLCVVMVLAVGAMAEAQVIWDYGPTTGASGGCWSNTTAGQNFAEEIVFANPTAVNGMDIWTCIAPTAGTVHIKILLDNGSGAPGAVFTEWDQAPTSWVADGPGYMVSADFADVNLAAGQIYWIGISGNGFELGQLSVLTPGYGSVLRTGVLTFYINWRPDVPAAWERAGIGKHPDAGRSWDRGDDAAAGVRRHHSRATSAINRLVATQSRSTCSRRRVIRSRHAQYTSRSSAKTTGPSKERRISASSSASVAPHISWW